MKDKLGIHQHGAAGVSRFACDVEFLLLSAAKAKVTESTDYYLGTTADQVAAKQIGQKTRLPSLELAMDLLQTVGHVTTATPACITTTCGRRPPRHCRRSASRLVFENLLATAAPPPSAAPPAETRQPAGLDHC